MFKKWKKLMVLGMTGIMTCMTLAGCGSQNSAKHDYDLYIFNGKTENAKAMEALCKEYEAEKGVKVKVFSLGTTELMQTLRAEMNSSEKPSLFSCNADTLTEWKDGGFVQDLNKIEQDGFKELIASVPESMRLSGEGGESYGIPYNIEGYGLIADKQMLMDLFGLTDTEAFVTDYKAATYEEFQGLVKAVDAFIKNGSADSVSLNGTAYPLAASKTERTEKLNGVFSVAGAEKWTYGNHFSNYPLNTVFKSFGDVKKATEEQLEELREPIQKSVKDIEFITNYLAGPTGALTRSPEFINSTIAGYDQAVQTFAEGKALFIKQGNWIYSTVEKVAPEVAQNLTMLPMKVSFTQEDIKVKDLTIEKFNASIPEFVPSYYNINAKVSEEEQKAAAAFLVWLNTSERGKKAIAEDFAFVPFNATKDTVIENPLGKDLVTYMNDGAVLCEAFNAIPTNWGIEVYGKYLMENLFIKEQWTEDDAVKMSEECITKWKEMQVQ